MYYCSCKSERWNRKTTTCVNLGIGLARAGKKVLLVDADVQLRTSEHRSMYSYVRLSIDRCTATYV